MLVPARAAGLASARDMEAHPASIIGCMRCPTGMLVILGVGEEGGEADELAEADPSAIGTD